MFFEGTCIAATQRQFFLLLHEWQKLTWQKSTFTKHIHLLKAVDQLKEAKSKSKAQNKNTGVFGA